MKGPWHVREFSLFDCSGDADLFGQVHVLGALPLRSLSRLWGTLNSLELPIWFRPYGIKVYAYIFGCNLNEIEPSDLKAYRSLGEFFYRKLKDGARIIESGALVGFIMWIATTEADVPK